jgi:hypothetical protein
MGFAFLIPTDDTTNRVLANCDTNHTPRIFRPTAAMLACHPSSGALPLLSEKEKQRREQRNINQHPELVNG